ncbi:MAG: hypothetical protein ACYCSF_11815 [Acidimicrobiales bacterium]
MPPEELGELATPTQAALEEQDKPTMGGVPLGIVNGAPQVWPPSVEATITPADPEKLPAVAPAA